MKRMVLFLFPLFVVAMTLAGHAQLTAPGADNTPQVGAKAPEFDLLKTFQGQKKVLLAFFPAAFTGG